jgi:uncharacterized protein YbaR (Trm112 family)
MKKELLEILVCPLCKGQLIYNKSAHELICRFDRLAYPIKQDTPIMLAEDARELTLEELEKLK